MHVTVADWIIGGVIVATITLVIIDIRDKGGNHRK